MVDSQNHVENHYKQASEAFSYDLKFWVQSNWSPEEKMFQDCEYTRKFPLRGLEYIHNSTDYDFHVIIQNHLNFINPSTISETILKLEESPLNTVACLDDINQKSCRQDMIGFTAATGKNLYRFYTNRPKVTVSCFLVKFLIHPGVRKLEPYRISIRKSELNGDIM